MAKAEKTLKIKLVKSLNGRLEKHIATAASLGLRKIGQVSIQPAYSLGLKKIGQTTEQPDNAATRGKIKTISHLIEVTE